MAAKDKDTIYIDIDDEITGIIDKLKGSDSKVVALVLPKRATVFQSIVNMKLLKRAADGAKKNAVLITSESGLLPLAGAAGIHVAKTLNARPEIPSAPSLAEDIEEAIEEDALPVATEPQIDPQKPVGQLAGSAPKPKPADGGIETLVLDDEDLPPEADTPKKPGPKEFTPPTKPKNKKLKIPNFERFRLLLVLGGLILILLISGITFALTALPKAVIAIKTDATNLDVNANLNLSTAAQSLDAENSTLPAKLTQQQKTYTQQVPTTGQKNNGNRASGTVTLVNCSETSDITVQAGTGLSSGGNTYITQKTVFVPASSFKKGDCENDGTADVDVLAQNPGTSYNGATRFSVAGQPDITGSVASPISGGTDDIVQIVNQNDINSAKNKISANNEAEMKQALSSKLKADGYYPIAATYTASTPNTTTSANVGDVANNVTVTETVTYTMFGVHEDDLNAIIDSNIKDQIDTSKQSILDRGLDSAVFNVDSMTAQAAQLTISTKAEVGPDLDVNSIKKLAAGKRSGEVKDSLKNNPDVTSVDVKLSPFWVSTVPKKTSRITVDIAKPAANAKASSSDASSP